MATEKKYHLIHDASTGEEIVREYTAEEYRIAEETDRAEAERRAAQEAEAERIATLKASAKAKLIAGQRLTAEEAELLVV